MMKGHVNNMFPTFEYKYVASTLKDGSCQFHEICKLFKCKLENKKLYLLSSFLFEDNEEKSLTRSFLDKDDNLCFMYVYLTDNDNNAMNELEFRTNFFAKLGISATVDCYIVIHENTSPRYLYLVRLSQK